MMATQNRPKPIKVSIIRNAMNTVPLACVDLPQIGYHATCITLSYVVWVSNVNNAIIGVMSLFIGIDAEFEVELIAVDEECCMIKLVFQKGDEHVWHG